MWIGPTLTKLFQDRHKKDRQETNCSFWPFLFYAKRNKQKKEKENWDWIDGNLMTKMRSKQKKNGHFYDHELWKENKQANFVRE